MTSPVAIAPGTVWVRNSGVHKNLRKRVTGVTSTKVKFVEVGGGDNYGSSKIKNHVQSCSIEEFLAAHTPAELLVSAGNGTSFRRVAEPKPKPVEEPMPKYEPARGLIKTSGRANVSVEMVTPDMAQAWLDRGGKNRKLSESKVLAYTAAMKRGEWQLTYEAIALDDDGKVRNGQHRLTAIVRSGVPIEALVVRGVDETAFDVMDTGKSRSIGDVLSIHGMPNVYALAAAVRNLMFLDAHGTTYANARSAAAMVTAPTTLKYIEDHPEVIEGVRLGDRIRGAGLQGGMGLWSAVATVWIRIDPEMAEEFGQALINGVGLEDGHPALMLRNRLFKARNTGEFGNTRKQQEALAATAIKAWNAWREGKTLQTLYWRQDGKKAEPFPKAI
jgi:hypothetical protein